MFNIFLFLADAIFQLKYFTFFHSKLEIFSFFTALILFFVLGFYDDKYGINPLLNLI